MEREEEELGSGGLQIRERKKRQEEEGEVLEEHRSVFFDPNHGCVVVEVASKTEITEAIQLGAHEDKTDGTDDSKGKGMQHPSIVQEPNQRLQNGNISNGSHELSIKTSANGTEGLKLLASSITEAKASTEGSNGASEACSNGSMGRTVAAHGIEEQGVAGLEGYDLGRILGEQETHDLICPNCNSCITRRVILRKRKRTARDGPRDEAAKRQQPEEPPAIAPAEAQVQTQDREVPCVFRCLSCFSFFIPTDGGFNIFRMFGKEETTTEVEIPHHPPSDRRSESCGSWLFSCFQSGDSPGKGNDQGLVHPSATHVGNSPSTGTPAPVAPPRPDLHIIVGQPDATPDQRDEWNILKPIVYGGLVESIASLSVVSSAAAGGAKTLNIFILGLANLIGGLPIIFHNLHDLRNAQDVADGSNERAGSYWEQLGRRSKFRLHMAVAVLSYILLGMLPPAIYGFSFREADDRELKIAAVAAASLLCIGLLAVGKAHVGARRAYVKTLLYYLTVAVSASGLAYAAGVLITRILAHFGLVDEGGAAPPPPPGLFFGMVSSGTAALASH